MNPPKPARNAQEGARAPVDRPVAVPARLVDRMRRFAAGDVPSGPLLPERIALLAAVLERLR
jgi:hypothetical protein